MSDYLSTLVARRTGQAGSSGTRDDAGAIRPRLPSLFEPLATAPVPPIGETSEAMPAASSLSEGGHRRVSRPVSRTRGDLGQPIGDLISHVATEHLTDDREASNEITTPGVEMADSGVSEQRDEGDRAGTTFASPIKSQRAAEPPVTADRPRNVPTGGHPAGRMDEIAESSTTAIDAQAVEPVRSSFRQTGTPLPRFTATDRSEPHPPHRAERVRPRDRVSGWTRAADQPASDSPEPTVDESPAIHVTIGRVEIRAAIPSAAQSTRPSVRSGLSLDEYLGKPARGDR